MSIRVEVLPLIVNVDDCEAYILEVLKNKLVTGDTIYHVSVKIKCGDVESKVFNISVRNKEELVAKLKIEVSKFKLMKYVVGKEFAARVIG